MYYIFYILVNHAIQVYGCKVNFKYTIYLELPWIDHNALWYAQNLRWRRYCWKTQLKEQGGGGRGWKKGVMFFVYLRKG